VLRLNIDLPELDLEGEKTLEECIYERKSVRKFSDRDIPLSKISQLLWSAQAYKNGNRTVPSAGATYPLEMYVHIKDKGLYYYNFGERILEQRIDEDISAELARKSLNQTFLHEAPVNIIICADYSRTCKRYGDRGRRYVHMEVGHSAQNVLLEVEALGLASVPIGAFKDRELKKLMKLSGELDVLYILPIGYPK
jgi:SagB-type dehydrogenase family enzyme